MPDRELLSGVEALALNALRIFDDGQWHWHESLSLKRASYGKAIFGFTGFPGLMARGMVECELMRGPIGNPRKLVRLTEYGRNADFDVDRKAPTPPVRRGDRELAARLWAAIEKRDADDCWVWTKASTREGYGKLSVGLRQYRAHRVSWEVTNGPIPPGLVVMHKCDNPACINPEHLMLGTHSENSKDMVKKDRNPSNRGRNWPRLEPRKGQSPIERLAPSSTSPA